MALKRNSTTDREERFYPADSMHLSLRDETREGKKSTKIEGYAAVYNVPTIIWDFEEVIDARAFERVLKEKPDTRSLFNHDSNYVLGRTKSGTLVLRSDDKGLWTETIPPNTPIADSIVESIRRGDVDGMSFAFTVRKQEWQFSDDPGQLDRRVITEIGQLYDIGPVTFPAYPQTSVGLQERAKEMHAEARSRFAEARSAMSVREGEKYNFVEARSADGLWLPELRKVDEQAEGSDTQKAGTGTEAQESRGESGAGAEAGVSRAGTESARRDDPEIVGLEISFKQRLARR